VYREITLSQETRCFRRVEGTQTLYFQNEFFRVGTVHTVSPPESLEFDHKPHSAVACTFGGQTVYMLVSEMKVLNS
jgi:hypothetical protein